jgi:hypothetical protein
MLRRTIVAAVTTVTLTCSWTTATASGVVAWDDATAAGLAQLSESTASLPVDLDGDGDLDVVWNRHAKQTTQLFYSDGSGRFTERFAGQLPARVDRHQCASADVDKDGLVDLYCVIGASYGRAIKANELWMQQPDGSFVERAGAYGVKDPYGRGRTATFLDVNDDGWPDLYVVNFFPRPDGLPTTNRLFLNQHGLSFAPAPWYGLDEEVGGLGTIPGCVQAVDYDADGDEDLLVCAARGLRLYRFDAAGKRFANVAPVLGVGSIVNDAEIADLNADGVLDLLTVVRTSLRIRFGTGSGTFTFVRFSRPLTDGRDAAVGESTGDGRPDIYVLQGQLSATLPNPPDVMLASTPNSWTTMSIPVSKVGCGSSVSVLDADGNGLDDYLVSNGARGLAGPTVLVAFGPAPP